MNIYKKWVILSSFIPLFIFMALSALFYIYDPLQLYHKPYFRKETFVKDRTQAKKIIDQYNFDSIILGTSMLQNTSLKESANKLGGKWVNLSIGGGTANERAIILDYAFKKKEIKNIIYSLDAWVGDRVADTRYFEAIYNDKNNFFVPLGIYINFKNPKFLFCALSYSLEEECVGKEYDDIEKLTSWIDDTTQYFGGFDNWKKYLESDKYKAMYIDTMKQIIASKGFNPSSNIDIRLNKSVLQKYLLSFVQENPNTNFYFIIPTYSRLAHLIGDSFYRETWLKWFIVETSKYPNVKIYGFDDLDYADNIANYKDPHHYNADMNLMHLDAIKNNTHILTPKNMDKYFEIMEEKIRNYDLEPFVKFAKEILNKN